MDRATLPSAALTAPWPIRRADLGPALAALLGEGSTDAPESSGPEVREHVAILPFFGVALQHPGMFGESGLGFVYTEVWGALFDELVADPSVGAIVPVFHSPGGVIYGVRELGQRIYDARGRKPIIAVANSMAASAALWIATAADKLYVTPGGEVGSIGVWTMHEDVSRLMDRIGVKITLVAAGQHKVEGNPWEPLDDDARAELQRSVDEVYDAFVGDIARNRGVTRAKVEADFGQGRMFSAPRAVAVGLADGVRTVDEVVGELARQIGLSVAPGVEGPTEARSPTLAQGADVRASDEKRPRVVGVGMPYGMLSDDLGGFVEVFEPGAFSESVGGDVRVLWQHDDARVLGRTTAGTAGLSDDARALRYWAQPPRTTWADDAIESIRRGDVTGSSIRFRVLPGGQRWERRDGVDTRIVSRAQLFECSPVTFPAYADTSAAIEAHRAWVRAGRPDMPVESGRRYRLRAAERAHELAAAPGGLLEHRARAWARSTELRRDAERARKEERRDAKRAGTDAWYRWRAALHEAGHAVVGYLEGVDFHSLSIEHARPGAGHAFRNDDVVTARYLAAGIAAEKLAASRGDLAGPVDPFSGGGPDFDRIRAELGGAWVTDAQVRAVIASAEHRLRDHWPAVLAVAWALQDRGELTGVEASEIIVGALVDGAPDAGRGLALALQ